MSLEIQTTIESDFLRVTVTGDYSFSKLFEFIEFVRAKSDKNKRTRALIDCRAMAGMMTEIERFEGGQRIAEVFGGHLKAALMMRPNAITRLGELAARNRGAKFFVTPSEPEALAWLLAA
jgi:hypothetical protein